ncbi:MAG TPA: hypothetical protein VM925_20735 [Labilithrix sp.]|jgi:hypothetical protein|nr:hypothetical protein [Labilithrix sp.]
MRSNLQANAAFLGGVVVGLGVASVALLTVATVRRARSHRLTTERTAFIDGVHPPNAAELDARPAEEANANPRLESEAIDMSALSQRW